MCGCELIVSLFLVYIQTHTYTRSLRGQAKNDGTLYNYFVHITLDLYLRLSAFDRNKNRVFHSPSFETGVNVNQCNEKRTCKLWASIDGPSFFSDRSSASFKHFATEMNRILQPLNKLSFQMFSVVFYFVLLFLFVPHHFQPKSF